MASFFLPYARGETGSTDCIIIGAGIAGLAAGDYLRKKGSRVTILEARERVGGQGSEGQKLVLHSCTGRNAEFAR